MTSALVGSISRALLVTVFALAALGKLRSRRAFAEFVRSLLGFGGLTYIGWSLIATALVVTEAMTVLLLFVVPALGFLISLLLLSSFMAFSWGAIRRGRQSDCRCFGTTGGILTASHLVRDGLLLLVATFGLMTQLFADAPLPFSTLVLTFGIGALGGLVVSRWTDLMFVLRR